MNWFYDDLRELMDMVAKRLKTFGLAAATFALMAAPAIAQGQGPGPGPGQGPGFRGYGHPMMGWGGHHFGGWGIGHGFILLLALIGLIAVVLGVIRVFRHGCPWHHHHYRGMGTGAGLEILETRYARGEINRDEYLEKKRDLTSRV